MNSTPRAAVLGCERLESREVPAVLIQSFDTAIVSQLPAGWGSWRSNPAGTAAVTNGRSISGENNLQIGGISNSTVRTWTNQLSFADGQIAADVYLDSLSPATVFVRGSNLSTAASSQYTASVVRGAELRLSRTVNGVETTLASIRSRDYFSQKWVQVVVDASGSTIRAGLMRRDSGQWLSASGLWVTSPTFALTATDSAISAAGRAGIGRNSGTASPVIFDDVRIVTPDTPPFNPPPGDTGTPATPAIPKNYSHIRSAQLAYSGNPLGPFEQQKLKTSVDLVIPATTLASKVNTADATVPQLLYTNVSNIYLDLLRDWNEYADRNKLNREQAYYHVSQSTAWQGSSPSSIPVNQFWSVTRGSATGNATLTDLTSASRGQASFGVALGTTGDALAMGFPERFRELNITITQAAASSYSGVWEYASAVNSQGVVTAWKSLRINLDSTTGWRKTGQITFDPPADWVAGRQTATGPYLHFVRFRTTSGTAALAPEAKTILGRDFSSAVNGKGTIPAFDSTADANQDGYLTDAEYAKRRAGFDARFIHESRLFYPYYGPMRYVTNPASAGVKAWAVDFSKRQLAANPLYNGLFIDNSNGKLPFTGTAVVESTVNYTADAAALVGAVWRGVSPKLVFANTVGSIKEADGIAANVPGTVEEFLLRPTEASWSRFNDVVDIVKRRLATPNAPYLILDSHPGSQSVSDPRVQIGTLAYYYLLGDPDRTMLMMFGGYKPSAAWQDGWITAAETDIGQPREAFRTLATGKDPENTKLEYRIYSRDYDKALVLYKPRSYASGTTGTINDSTATTHQLNGRYRLLNANGSLGPVITQITLRNGEGAVLIKQSSPS